MGNIISANIKILYFLLTRHVLLDHMIVILYTITVILMINYYTMVISKYYFYNNDN
jgi:hypothetical protein